MHVACDVYRQSYRGVSSDPVRDFAADSPVAAGSFWNAYLLLLEALAKKGKPQHVHLLLL